MNNANMAKVLQAQDKGKEIEVKGDNGFWKDFTETDFDFLKKEYRVKETHKIREFFGNHNSVWGLLKSERSLNIQTYLMAAAILGTILYTFWLERGY